MESILQSDLSRLSQELKPIIWVITAYNKDGEYYGIWTRFCVKSDGLIMTCAHGFIENKVELVLKARRLVDDNQGLIYNARIVSQKPNWDITLLHVDGIIGECKVGVFSNGLVFEGETVLLIGNTHGLEGSFSVGHCTYPCVENDNVSIPTGNLGCSKYESTAMITTPIYRVMGDTLNKDSLKKVKTRAFKYFENVDIHPLVPVVQCKGLGAAPGTSGGPLFNAQGEIIGMHVQTSFGYQNAVHVSLLKEFLNIALPTTESFDPTSPREEKSEHSKAFDEDSSIEGNRFEIHFGSSKRMKK